MKREDRDQSDEEYFVKMTARIDARMLARKSSQRKQGRKGGLRAGARARKREKRNPVNLAARSPLRNNNLVVAWRNRIAEKKEQEPAAGESRGLL